MGADILGKVLLSRGLELRELFLMEGTVLRPKKVGHLNSVLGLNQRTSYMEDSRSRGDVGEMSLLQDPQGAQGRKTTTHD